MIGEFLLIFGLMSSLIIPVIYMIPDIRDLADKVETEKELKKKELKKESMHKPKPVQTYYLIT